MSSDFDASDFVDTDLQSARKETVAYAKPAYKPEVVRPVSREEVTSKLSSIQNELAEISRLKEQREQELAQLAELQRRQQEYRTSREEALQNLTRGMGLLTEAEFKSRREAEQMNRTLIDFKAALEKVNALHEENWDKDHYDSELTRALTTLENSRMEWNSARQKFTVLDGNGSASPQEGGKAKNLSGDFLSQYSFGQLTKIGLAFLWPLIAVAAVFGLILIFKK